MTGVQTHYTCHKGNDHWLSHVSDWDGDQYYPDGCHVHINIEGGHAVHLSVLPDLTKEEARAKGWYVG